MSKVITLKKERHAAANAKCTEIDRLMRELRYGKGEGVLLTSKERADHNKRLVDLRVTRTDNGKGHPAIFRGMHGGKPRYRK